jgi:hypothetical protein
MGLALFGWRRGTRCFNWSVRRCRTSAVCAGSRYADQYTTCARLMVGLCSLLFIIPVLIWRPVDGEKLLKKDLPGYTEYTGKVCH